MKTVFIAEDDQDLLQLVADGISGALDCRVVPFVDGNSLLQALKCSEHPDLIISDLCMPNGSGLDVWTFLQDASLSIPIVFYSSSSVEAIPCLGHAAPPTYFVVKGEQKRLHAVANSLLSTARNA